MALLKPSENSNMYPGWWRWNPISGCEHGCIYCYVAAMEKRFGKDMTIPKLQWDYLNDNLGSGRKIFVCSSGDMWGDWVCGEWIDDVLAHCEKYPENRYMFLTKNPEAYDGFRSLNKGNYVLGATIETDIEKHTSAISNAPQPMYRLGRMQETKVIFGNVETMISVEPVMEFSGVFLDRLLTVAPDIIYIGADSGNNGLPEPTPDEIRELIAGLRNAGIEVHTKKNLARLLPELAEVRL